MLSFLLTEADCGGIEVLKVLKFVWSLLDLVFIFVPIGLIVFISIDFAKNVMAGREDEMKKNLSIAIKRIIFCVVLFLVPVIVDIVISVLDNSGVKVISNFDECIEMAEQGDFSEDEQQEQQQDDDTNTGNGSGGGNDSGSSPNRPNNNFTVDLMQ